MGIIAWLVLGLVAGYIASKIVDHRGLGVVRDMLLGILGAFVGGALFHLFTGYRLGRLNVGSILVATGGAILVLIVRNALRGRKRSLLPH